MGSSMGGGILEAANPCCAPTSSGQNLACCDVLYLVGGEALSPTVAVNGGGSGRSLERPPHSVFSALWPSRTVRCWVSAT